MDERELRRSYPGHEQALLSRAEMSDGERCTSVIIACYRECLIRSAIDYQGRLLSRPDYAGMQLDHAGYYDI